MLFSKIGMDSLPWDWKTNDAYLKCFISTSFNPCDGRNRFAAVLDYYCGINWLTSNKLRSTSTSDLQQKIIWEWKHSPAYQAFVIFDYSRKSISILNCHLQIFTRPCLVGHEIMWNLIILWASHPLKHPILVRRIWHGLPRFRTFWTTLCSSSSTPVLMKGRRLKFLLTNFDQ